MDKLGIARNVRMVRSNDLKKKNLKVFASLAAFCVAGGALFFWKQYRDAHPERNCTTKSPCLARLADRPEPLVWTSTEGVVRYSFTRTYRVESPAAEKINRWDKKQTDLRTSIKAEATPGLVPRLTIVDFQIDKVKKLLIVRYIFDISQGCFGRWRISTAFSGAANGNISEYLEIKDNV
jgi:hypothetical protein